MDSEFLEKLILKGSLTNKEYLVRVVSFFEKRYFENSTVAEIYNNVKNYLLKYNEIPSETVLINLLDEEYRIKAKNLLEEIKSINFDVAREYKFLIEETNNYLKNKALVCAVLDVVDILEGKSNNKDLSSVRRLIEDALTKDLLVNLGTRYFDDLYERLKRIFNSVDVRVPTYFPKFDEFINGGFPPFTLSVIMAKIHGGKTNTIANFAARQAINGHNVVLFTMEMSEDEISRRFDSIYSLLDINSIYISDRYKKELVKKLSEVKKIPNRGNLYIKYYPTGTATVNDFKVYLRELQMRDIKPDIIYADYINIMRSVGVKSSGDLYSLVKGIAEELRALSGEFTAPVISVSQFNREGMNLAFRDVGFTQTAESIGVPAVADFIAIYGEDEEKMLYESEIHYKIEKNRIGGRVGSIGKFFFDTRSLKLYDETEERVWYKDAETSGDKRNIKNRGSKENE